MVFFHFETPSVMATLGASEGSEREAREWREREKEGSVCMCVCVRTVGCAGRQVGLA